MVSIHDRRTLRVNADNEPSTTRYPEASGGASLPCDPEAVAPLVRGALLGRYVIVAPLGRGGMGQVYVAYDPQLNRRLALKLTALPEDLVTEARAQIMREAQAQAAIAHPHVVPVYDVGLHEHAVYLAMELAEGGTLRDWLRAQPRSWREVGKIFLQAGLGLKAVHARGWVHRDFKPENVLIDRYEVAKIADFGLVSLRSATGGRLHSDGLTTQHADSNLSTNKNTSTTAICGSQDGRPGEVMGSPPYMAPEQHLGTIVTPLADQFSFCVALFEALCETRPFHGDTFEALRDAIVDGPAPVWPMAAVARVPKRLRALVDRGLNRDAGARFEDLDALLQELKNVTATRASAARRALVLGSIAAAALGLGVVMDTEADKAQACATPHEQGEQIFAAAQHQALSQAFAKSLRLHAAATFEAVAMELDDYVGTLSAALSEVCQDAHADAGDAQAHAKILERKECLDDRRAQATSLIQAFMGADGATVDRALAATMALQPIDDCLRANGPIYVAPQPAKWDQRESVAALRSELARVSALATTGQVKQALAQLEPLRDKGQKVAFLPAIAESELAYGAVLLDLEQVLGARKVVDRALLLTQAGEDDWVQARGQLLSTRLRIREADFDALDENFAILEAVIQRAGAPLTLQADFADLLVNRAYERTDNAATVALSIAAEQRAIEAFGPASLRRLRYLVVRGTALHRLGQHVQARETLQKALVFAEKRLGRDHPEVAGVWNAVGNVRHFQGDYPGAMQAHERALAIRRASFGEDSLAVGSSLYNLANTLQSRGQPHAALAVLERVYVIEKNALGPKHPWVADVQNNRGISLLYLGRLDEAEAFFREALVMRQQAFGASSTDIAQTLINLGLTLTNNLDLSDGETILREALAMELRHRLVSHNEVLEAKMGLVGNLILQHRVLEASTLLDKVTYDLEANLMADHPMVAAGLQCYGDIAYLRGNWAEALVKHEQALSVYQRSQGAGQSGEIAMHVAIGLDLLELGERQKTAAHCELALQQALALGVELDRKLLADSYACLARYQFLEHRGRRMKNDALEMAREHYAGLGTRGRAAWHDLTRWIKSHP